LAFKTAVLGKYYDLITPFATGGQPFQIYYTNKYGIKGGESLSVVMSEYMFQQIGYVIIVMAVMILWRYMLVVWSHIVFVIVWILLLFKQLNKITICRCNIK
jgi:hypothetical protein